MIDAIRLNPYRLPMHDPWVSAHGRLAERSGWLVRIDAADHSGFGDCAPLAAAGTETPQQAKQWLDQAGHQLVGLEPGAGLDRCQTIGRAAPAARYALECALSDLIAQRSGQTLRHWLAPDAGERVGVNAMLGSLTTVTHNQIQAACATGYRVLKIKVGLMPAEMERARLAELVASLPPGVGLRLDANGAWDMATASWLLEQLADWPIEAIEEPLRAPSAADLRRLQASTRIPLALDETLHRPDLPADLAGILRGDPGISPTRRLVLKPAAIGGLRTTLEQAQQAISAGLQIVITSLIESAAGLWPTLQLAAALPAGQPPHGLATSSWLVRDLGAPPVIDEGQVRLPRSPGSGFRPMAA
ncbi:o-succinylbenzoate synthase [Thioalkalicoccus limnaeus]|uniref:o-succinylbenzoate synthase n=1 Tax=Thioalkalicoccus limnaeus TaxID=120681 RepID=A0ABV4BDB9_9GAMM